MTEWGPPVFPLNVTKKRKLMDMTVGIMRRNTNFLDNSTQAIIKEQNLTFDAYENELGFMRSRLSDMTEQLRIANLHGVQQQHQIELKSKLVTNLKNSVSEVTTENSGLKLQIDDLNMRYFEAIASKEESERHYKSVILGLQKTAANAEEASAYMRRLNKLFNDYAHGEKLDDSDYKTERKCVICMSEPANIVVKPCHHLEFCSSCAIDLFELKENEFSTDKTITPSKGGSCPRCKCEITHFDYIYA
tara:strand:- start:4453 stop:5193 length:741 start_codon:yes stop_codon:yes gene_type:complete